MNQSEFAKHIGKSQPYVTKLKQEGRLVLDETGKIDAEASIKKIEQTSSPESQSVVDMHQEQREGKEDDLPGKAGSVYQESRAMQKMYDAKRSKLEYEAEIKKYIKKDEIEAAIFESDTVIRTKLEAMPYLLAPQLATEVDESVVLSILIDQVEQVLRDLSENFKKLAYE